MRRYGYNSRLFKDSLDEKRHYKLYKKGKMWLVAGISVFSSGLAYSVTDSASAAQADTATTATSNSAAATTSSSSTDESSASDTAATVVTATTVSDDTTASTESSTSDATSTDETQTNQTEGTTSSDTTSDSSTTTTDSSEKTDSGSDADAESTKEAKTSDTDEKSTAYTKEAGQKAKDDAAKAVASIQASLEESNTSADASDSDNIVRDRALDALYNHTATQSAQVADAIDTADTLVQSDPEAALTQFNSALSIISKMQDSVEQAGVMLSSDKKGVQATVLGNAKAAYEQISMPTGATAVLDDYGDLVVSAVDETSYQAVIDNLTQSGLIGSFRSIVDPQSSVLSINSSSAITTDASGNAVLDASKINSDYTSMSVNYSYTGDVGDKFTLTIPASLTSGGWSISDFNGYYRANGSITSTDADSTVNPDGSVTLTWTVGQAGQTTTQTISFKYAGDSLYTVNGDLASGTLASGGIGETLGTVKDETVLPFVTGGNTANGTAMTETAKTVTIKNSAKINKVTISTVNQDQFASTNLQANENYVYQVSATNGETTRSISSDYYLKSATIKVPTNFILNEELTNKANYQINAAILGMTIQQTGGAGGDIVVTGGNSSIWDVMDSSIKFVGSYSEAATGVDQTFTLSDLQYSRGNDNNASGTLGSVNGSSAVNGITPNTSGINAWISYDGPVASLTTQLGEDGYSSVISNIIGPNSTNSLGIGDSTNNVIATFGYENTGSTTIKVGTLTVNVPDQVISTGLYVPIASEAFSDWTNNEAKTYDITVVYSDGTSDVYTGVKEGTTLSSIAPDVDTAASQMVTMLASHTGAQISEYFISTSMKPGENIQPYYDNIGSGGEQISYSPFGYNNDLYVQRFGLLGYVNGDGSVKVGDTFDVKVNLGAGGGQYVKTTPSSLTLTAADTGVVSANTLSDVSSALVPGSTFTLSLGQQGNNNAKSVTNLNANGYYVNNVANGGTQPGGYMMDYANQPTDADANDSAGSTGVGNFITQPVFYVTVPDQTSVVNNASTGELFTRNGAGWSSIAATTKPTVSTFTNADGQTVYKLDFTGVTDDSGKDFVWNPSNMWLSFDFKVDEDAYSEGLGIANTKATSYQIGSTTKTIASATTGGTGGESTATFMIQGEADSTQSASANFDTDDADDLFTTLTDSNGATHKASGLTTFAVNGTSQVGDLMQIGNGTQYSGTVYIQAPSTLVLTGRVKGNIDTSAGAKGNNYPVENGTDTQAYTVRLSNNTTNEVTNVAGVVNLPQEVTANTSTDPGKFALQLTGPATEATSTAGESTVTLYSTHTMTLSGGDQGKYVQLDNGHVYYFNAADGTSTTDSSDLMSASDVSDWSTIKSFMTSISSLGAQDSLDVTLPMTDPTSAEDAGKSVIIDGKFRSDGKQSVSGSVTDNFYTGATVKNVDQDGNEINGYPEQTADYDTGTLVGAAGDSIINTPESIPGYILSWTDGDTTFKPDGSSVAVNHYQVNQASLTTVNKPDITTQLSEVATGNSTANTGSSTATSSNTITFTTTDADLAVDGYTYTVSINGQDFATLADAVSNNASFDDQIDNYGNITQQFTVNYAIAAGAITVGTATKVYSGTAADNPATYDVTLPTGVVAPTWTAADFDTTGITSQNVGTYNVTLSQQGLDDLKAANATLDFSFDNVTGGTLTITPAEINIKAPTLSKTYDGNPVDPSTVVGYADGWTDTMTYPEYTLTDVSADTEVGTYDINVDYDAESETNKNFTITTTPGNLTITPMPSGSITIGDKTKVYDGDATTDPTIYDVTLSGGLVAPTWADGDFNLDNITSQNVGSYKVSLSAQGFDALQAANPNFQVSWTDITEGNFVITKAPVTVTADNQTKIYDGTPFTDQLTATVAGQPTAGDAVQYDFDDISSDINAGTYDITLTTDPAANGNYDVTLVKGQLDITASDNISVMVGNDTKVYDGDATNMPTTFSVNLPSGVVAPTWTTADFDLSGITSQNVGDYTVTLSAQGIADLQALNTDYVITSDNVTAGNYSITPAPITITADNQSKTYDGSPFTDTLTAHVDGLPDSGDTPVYTFGDISSDINAGTYDITVSADAATNPNYTITVANGTLTINASTVSAGITVGSNTKVYDGDETTDPTVFDVTLPSELTAPTWEADDFDLSGITSQNVGSYKVSLSDAGLAKLQAANPDYQFTWGDVTQGDFSITPADITITATDQSKTFDGTPYTGSLTATVDGQPSKGVDPVYTFGDLSSYVAAGTYDITVNSDPSTNGNYNVTAVKGTLTITAAGLSSGIVIGSGTKVYDGDETTDQTVFDVTLPSELTAPTWDASDFDVKVTSQNVGDYGVSLSADGLAKLQAANPDYSIDWSTLTEGTYSITKAPITITADDKAKLYDGNAYTDPLTATVDGQPTHGDAPVYEFGDISGDVNVGTYDITVSADPTVNGNYDITLNNGHLTISQTSLSAGITLGTDTKVYDGDATTDPTIFDVTLPSELTAPTWDADDFDLSGITSQNVGTYTVKLSDTGLAKLQTANLSYSISASDIADGSFDITKAPVTVTADNVTKIYDGSPYTEPLTAQVSGQPTLGDTVTYELGDVSGDVDVNTYDITVGADVSANSNYDVTFVPGTLTITPTDQISVLVGNDGKVYDGDADNTPTAMNITLPAGVNTPTWTDADFDFSGIDSQNVGDYTITLSDQGIADLQAANGNFTITRDNVTAGTYTITKAPITITADDKSKTYDGSPYTDALTAQVDGQPTKGDTPVYTFDDISGDVNVGTYDITVNADAAENSNYDVTVKGAKLTISSDTQAMVTIGNNTKVYDGDSTTNPTTYDVTLPTGVIAPTWTAADFDLSGVTSQNVGNYAITLSAKGLADLQAANSNFTFTLDNITAGNLEITKAPVTITGDDVSKAYDGSAYTGTLTAQVDGKPTKGDALVYDFGDISGDVAAGTYDIAINADATANSNYDVTVDPGTLTITPSTTATVTVGSGHKVYDGDATTDPTSFEVQLPTGVIAPTWTSDDFDLSGITSQNVGNYVVTLSDKGIADLQAANTDYTFTRDSVAVGNFEITKAPITITADDKTKVYDGTAYTDTLTAQVSGQPTNGDAPVYSFGDISGDINVGTYDITVNPDATANGNYDITVNAGQLTITPSSSAVVTVGSNTKVYDGDAITDPTTFEVTLPADAIAPTWTADDFDLSGITSQNVGNYVVTLSDQGIADLQAANSDYTFTRDNITAGNFEITKAPITVTADDKSKMYDGSAYTDDLTATVVGQPTNGNAPVYTFGDISSDIEVGNYDITVSADASENGNYDVTVVNGHLTISANTETTVTVGNNTKVYDGDETTDPTMYDVTLPTGVVAPTWTADDFDLSGITSQNVGNYAIKLSAQGLADLQAVNTNFVFSLDDIAAGNLEITKAPITITGDTFLKAYDGSAYTGTLTAQVDGKPAKGDTLVYSFGDISGDVAAGTYDVVVNAATSDNPNYEVTTNPGTLTITPSTTATVTVGSDTKVYDADATTDPTTFDVTLPTGVVAPTWTADDFDLSGITSQNVGNYVVTLSDQGIADLQAVNADYTFTRDSVAVGNFAITKAPITITADDKTKVYDGTAYTDTLTAQVSGQPTNGDAPVYTFADISGDVNVGTYDITVNADATENGNYDVTVKSGKLTITADTEATVTVGSNTKVYDGDSTTNPTTYDVTLPTGVVAPTWTAADFDLSGVTSQNVGNYAITLSAKGLADLQAANSNFTFTLDNITAGNLEITKAPVTITGDDVSKAYDGSAYTGTLTAQVDGKPTKGDALVYDFGDISGDVAAGTYDIAVNADTNANSNYDVTVNPGTLTITPSTTATVTVGNGHKVYDGDAATDPTSFEVQLPTGVIAPTWTSDDFDLSGITSQNVGNYVVTLSDKGIADLQAANTDYSFTRDSVAVGNFEITKAPITITADDKTKVYDGTAYTDTLTAQVSGQPTSGDAPVYSFGDISGDINVGIYDITVDPDASANGNYNITVTNGKLTITSSTTNVGVTVKGATKVYDGDVTTDPTTFEVDLPSNLTAPTWTADDFDLSGITSQNVGTYVVTLSATGLAKLQAANTNYTITDSDITSGNFEITKAPVTVTAGDATKIYDGTAYTEDLTANVTGQPTLGDTVSYEFGDISSDVNVGSYDIDVSADASANSNYNVTFVKGQLTITPTDQVAVLVGNATKVYDGDATTDPETVAVTLPSGITAPAWTAADFDMSGIDSQNVGDYVVTLSDQGIADLQAANTNYTITRDSLTAGKFTITKASITITADNASKAYDGNAYTDTLTAQTSGVPTMGDTPIYTFNDISGDVNVGSYDITITPDAAQNTNYNVSVEKGTLTITPSTSIVNVTIGNDTKVYDGDASTDPTTFDVTLPSSLVAPSWTADDFDLSGITSQNVGSYNVTLSASGLAKLQAANTNYTVTAADVKSGSFTITKAPVTISANDASKVYDGTAYTGTLEATVSGKPTNGDDLVYNFNSVASDVNVGSYDIVVNSDSSANSNYNVTVEKGTLTITPSTTNVGLAVEGGTKVYDGDASTDPTMFDVTLPSTLTAPVWTASDFDLSGITSQNVGSYEVTLSDSGLAKLQAVNNNFTVTRNDITVGQYVITKAPVTITAGDASKVYDGSPYTGTLTASVDGQPTLGDEVVYGFGNINGDVAAGTYDINVEPNAYTNTNYDITLVKGTLTITPVTDVTVSVGNASKTYDGDATTDPSVYTVSLPSGVVAPTWTADDFDLSGITSQNAGTYAVTLSDQGVEALQALNPNYDITRDSVTAGTFTINKANITITADSATKLYDGTAYTEDLTAKVSGQPAKGDAPVYTFEDISNDVNVGSYDIVVTPDATANDNYNVTTVDGQLIITPVSEVAVIVGNDSKVYDGDASTDPKVYDVALPTGVVAPTWEASDFDLSGIDSQNVGTYNVTLSAKGLAKLQALNTNFTITVDSVTDGTFTITKAPVTISGPTLTKDYDGQSYTGLDNVATITGQPAKGDALVYTMTDISQDVELGSYPITVTADESANGNYDVTVVDGSLTINDTAHKVTTTYVDELGNDLAKSVTTDNLSFGDSYSTSPIVIDGYYLTTTPTNASGTVGHDDTNVAYVYAKVGDYVITPPTGSDITKVPYPNDPDDPSKVTTPTTGIVPNVPGYTPVDSHGNELTPIDKTDLDKGYLPPDVPSDPSEDTQIEYTANKYTVTAHYVDEQGNKVADDVVTKDNKIGNSYSTTAKLVKGYYLTKTPEKASGTVNTDDIEITYVYNEIGAYTITPINGGSDTRITYPNDPKDPSKVTTPTTAIVPYVEGHTPVDAKGNKLTPIDPKDETKGYLPPATPEDPSVDTPIHYVTNTTTPGNGGGTTTPTTPTTTPSIDDNGNNGNTGDNDGGNDGDDDKIVTDNDEDTGKGSGNDTVDTDTGKGKTSATTGQKLTATKSNSQANKATTELPQTNEGNETGAEVLGILGMLGALGALGTRRKRKEED